MLKSSHSFIKRDAEELLTVRKSEIFSGAYKRLVKTIFGQFGDRYAEHAKANKRSWLREEQMLKHMKDFFGSQTELTEITPAEIEGFKLNRRKKVSGSTSEPGVGVAQAYVQSRHRLRSLPGGKPDAQGEILQGIQHRRAGRQPG